MRLRNRAGFRESVEEFVRRGRFGGNLPGSGPGGYCVCPSCGYSKDHAVGSPCKNEKCPKCGNRLIKSRTKKK